MARDYTTYQVLGVPIEGKNFREENSKFWNEGKWENFVVPHLPKDPTDMTFADMGCNAGLFLKLATDYGFKTAIGVDKHEGAIGRGREWRDTNGYDYQMSNCTLEEMIKEPYLADVTLFSNVHYYMRFSNWVRLVDSLRYRTRHVIIINRRPNMKHYDLVVRRLDRFFHDWEIDRNVIKLSTKGDPAPRHIRSHLYTAPTIKRVNLSDINESHLSEVLYEFYTNGNWDLYREHLLEKNKKKYSAVKTLDMTLLERYRLMKRISKQGQCHPIILNEHNSILDGQHRVAAMQKLGYKTVLARYL